MGSANLLAIRERVPSQGNFLPPCPPSNREEGAAALPAASIGALAMTYKILNFNKHSSTSVIIRGSAKILRFQGAIWSLQNGIFILSC